LIVTTSVSAQKISEGHAEDGVHALVDPFGG